MDVLKDPAAFLRLLEAVVPTGTTANQLHVVTRASIGACVRLLGGIAALRAGEPCNTEQVLATVADVFPWPTSATVISDRLDAPLDLCQELLAHAWAFAAEEDERDLDAITEYRIQERFERRLCA
jgi:hypothetical protein